MNLKEMQTGIENGLRMLTIDELYFKSGTDFSKEIFEIYTGCKSDAEILTYLEDAFPDTTDQTSKLKLNLIYSNHKEDLITIEKELVLSNQKKDTINAQRKEVLDVYEIYRLLTIRIDTETRQMDSELLNPDLIKNKPAYDKLVIQYDERKKELQSELDESDKRNVPYLLKFDKLRKQEIAVEKEGLELRKQIRKNKTQKKVFDLNAEEEIIPDEAFFADEYAALRFLYFILLGYEINSYADITKKTDTMPVLIKLKVSDAKLYEFAEDYTTTINYVPQTWRMILQDVIETPSITFKGVVYRNSAKGVYLDINEQILSTSDYSFILAIQHALKKSPSLTTKENKTVIPLSGGTIATITFRKRGATIPFDNTDFYINCLTEYKRSVKKILYYQSGNEDSTTKIEMPSGYYIVTEEYVIEIAFDAAPVFV